MMLATDRLDGADGLQQREMMTSQERPFTSRIRKRDHVIAFANGASVCRLFRFRRSRRCCNVYRN